MRTVTSELLKIRGVGPEKRRALLNAFGSVQGVRDAGVESIAQLPGFSLASAQRVLAALLPSEQQTVGDAEQG
jgi:excinuclease ABC subunit C